MAPSPHTMSDPETQPRPSPATGTRPARAGRGFWRALGSLRLAVVLLIVLAVASVIGIILPQPDSFNARTYVEERLMLRAEKALKPQEFLALARAADILPRSEAPGRWAARQLAAPARGTPSTAQDWASYYADAVRKIESGKMDEQAWDTFLRALASQVQGGEMTDAGLRLAYVDSYGRVIGGLFLVLRLHTLFSSVWFRALCVLLLANLVACSVRRLPGQWRAAFGHGARLSPEWYRNHAIHASLTVCSAPDAVAKGLGEALREQGVDAHTSGLDAAAAAVAEALRRHGFRVRRRRATGIAALEGTRGWLGGLGRLWWPLGKLAGLGRMGSQVVHLGVLLVVVGGFISGLLTFRHPQLLAPGDVVAVPDVSYRLSPWYQLRRLGDDALHWLGRKVEHRPSAAEAAASADDWRETDAPGQPPRETAAPGQTPREALFRLRLRRFEVRVNPRGKPEYYGAHVTLLGGHAPLDEVIEVNRPLVYRGFHAYQQSYQPDYSRITAASFVAAKIQGHRGAAQSPHGGEEPMAVARQFSFAAPLGADVAIPGTDITLRILRYFPHWQMPFGRGPDGRPVPGEAQNLSNEPMNPAIQVRLAAPGQKPRERWVMLPFRPGEPRQGGMIESGDYRIIPTDFTPGYNTWLIFKTHPVMLPVWVGCGVMMLGIFLAFYCNHERIWALARLRGDACEVLLAGNSFKWRERFVERFQAVTASIGGGAPGSKR